jgi:[ribosomal protein S5]-alanine N-acetyltransferase
MMELQTPRMRLILQTREEVRAAIAAMNAEHQAQVSPEWLARLDASPDFDPWNRSFGAVHRESGAVVGSCGFKGPPADGVVEIAYAIEPEMQGKGLATEAARALVEFAFSTGDVRVVRAHTLPQANASTRVLAKCGFTHVGQVIDPEDGPVWRFELAAGAPRVNRL